ncbi:hypothetical protein PYCC9005_004562 [Savitreella phatthalungensis]
MTTFVPAGAQPPKMIQVKLSPETLEEIIANASGGFSVDFDKLEFLVGKSFHKFTMSAEASPLDICRPKPTLNEELCAIGRVGQKIAVQRSLGGSATEKLKSRQAEERAMKQNRSVQEVAIEDMVGTRGHKRSTSLPPARSATPELHSPRHKVATSVAAPSSLSRRSNLLVASAPKVVIPLRTRALQLLAVGPLTRLGLQGKLRTAEDISPLLQEIAELQKDGATYELRPDAFRSVKIWEWRSYTSAERQQVISRVSAAFDRLDLPHDDPRRQKLIHPEKRRQQNAESETSDSSVTILGSQPQSPSATISLRPDEEGLSPRDDKLPRTSPLKASFTSKPDRDASDAPSPRLPASSKSPLLSGKVESGEHKPIVREERTKADGVGLASCESDHELPSTRIVKLRLRKRDQVDTTERVGRATAPAISRNALRTPSPRALEAGQLVPNAASAHDRTSSMASTSSVRSISSASTVATSTSTNHSQPSSSVAAPRPVVRVSKFLQSSRYPPPVTSSKSPASVGVLPTVQSAPDPRAGATGTPSRPPGSAAGSKRQREEAKSPGLSPTKRHKLLEQNSQPPSHHGSPNHSKDAFRSLRSTMNELRETVALLKRKSIESRRAVEALLGGSSLTEEQIEELKAMQTEVRQIRGMLAEYRK